MKKHLIWKLLFASFALTGTPIVAADAMTKPIAMRIVNFKTCVETSKAGKQEQAAFEALKKQIELTLEDKEKTLNDLANKLNDVDYLDSLSPEAETELKRKFRALNQELNQQQNQFFQSLNQTNVRVVQKLSELVGKASTEVAQKQGIQMILNEETSFFYAPDLDISKDVVAVMDRMYEAEVTNAKQNASGQEGKKG